jgi:hypothetical protein
MIRLGVFYLPKSHFRPERTPHTASWHKRTTIDYWIRLFECILLRLTLIGLRSSKSSCTQSLPFTDFRSHLATSSLAPFPSGPNRLGDYIHLSILLIITLVHFPFMDTWSSFHFHHCFISKFRRMFVRSYSLGNDLVRTIHLSARSSYVVQCR